MATYELPISSPLTETGDDVYCKPTDSDFAGGGTWGTSVVSAIELSDTNVYLATLDETKGYLVYLNGTSNTFTANAGTDVITDNSHGLLDGETLRFKGTDLPAGLVQTTLYYVRDKTANTFKVALTGGGAAVDITDAGTGVMVYVAPVQRSKSADVYLGAVPIVNAGTISAGEETAIAEAVATRLGVASADVDTHLHAIQAKTDLIGTAAAPITTHDGGSIYAVVGSTANATIVCSEDISAKTVQVVFETIMSKTDVATIANASVTKSTTSATFALPSAATASERTLRVTVRDTTSFKAYGSAILFVTYDAKGD